MGKGVRFIGILLLGLYLGMYFKSAQTANKPTIEWHQEYFGDIEFQSPFKFESDPDMPPIPAEVAVMIKEFRQMRAVGSGDVKMSIAKSVYNDQVKVSLEGAAQGSINAMARDLGDQKAIPSFDPIQGKSYDGYIGIYNTTIDNKMVMIRGAYIVKGQSLYMVLVSFADGQFSEDDIYKVFNSIEFASK